MTPVKKEMTCSATVIGEYWSCFKSSVSSAPLFSNCCVGHYSFNPFVDKAVNPLGTLYSNLPIPDALVPSEDIAVVPK